MLPSLAAQKQRTARHERAKAWIPAFAGMTANQYDNANRATRLFPA